MDVIHAAQIQCQLKNETNDIESIDEKNNN